MKNNNLAEKFARVPFGILAGIFGIFSFYDTIGVVALYIINSKVSAQTSQTATLFDTWYQTSMFILDIVFVIIFLSSLFFYIKSKIGKKKELKNESI